MSILRLKYSWKGSVMCHRAPLWHRQLIFKYILFKYKRVNKETSCILVEVKQAGNHCCNNFIEKIWIKKVILVDIFLNTTVLNKQWNRIEIFTPLFITCRLNSSLVVADTWMSLNMTTSFFVNSHPHSVYWNNRLYILNFNLFYSISHKLNHRK